MDRAKRKKLERAGWRVGSAADFLELSADEAAFVKLKLSLAQGVHQEREKAGLTQTELAARIGSSQSRVAKIESADPSVSVDLALRALFALGVTLKRLGKIVAAPVANEAA